MTLLDALPATFEGGERIRRSLWPSPVYCIIVDKQLCINWSNGGVSAQWHPLIVSEEDYFADDWEVVE